MVAAHSPRETALGIVVVAAGLPVYALFRRQLPGKRNLVEAD
jgi:hypothetical protein